MRIDRNSSLWKRLYRAELRKMGISDAQLAAPAPTLGMRLSASLKAVSRMIFGGGGGAWWGWGNWGGLLPRTRIDYAAQVGDGRGNAIVVACLEAYATAFTEAPLRVSKRKADNTLEPIPEHPMLALLARPNPYYSGLLLLRALVADWLLGNGYAVKVRSGAGLPVELYWVPQSLILPRWPDDGREFIGWYDYKPDGRAAAIRLETRDVIHLRNGFDPANPRLGISRLSSLSRELFTDDEAANFAATLLANMAVPGVIIAPEGDDVSTSEEDAEETKAAFMAKFGGDRRGEPMVMRSPTKVSLLSFSPQQMDLKALRRLPEERVSAALGVPAIVAGLGAGLDRSTYSNFSEARESMMESTIVPAQRLVAADLAHQLLPDFEGDAASLVVDFDLSAVRILQEDQDNLHARMREDVRAGMLTIDEARSAIGLDPLPDGAGDVLLVPIAVTPTAPADLLAPAAAPPPAAIPAQQGLQAAGRPIPLRKGRKAAVNLEAALRRLRRRLEPALRRDLERLLGEQAGAAAAALDADAIDASALAKLLEPHHLRVLDLLVELAQVALAVEFDVDDAATRAYLAVAGRNIVGITETTRQAVRDALSEGQAAGENLQQLADRIRGLPAFTDARAATVARTELGEASIAASRTAYRASGVVVGMRILDGDYDEACAARDGRVLSLDAADDEPSLLHPNCTAVWVAVLDPAELEAA